MRLAGRRLSGRSASYDSGPPRAPQIACNFRGVGRPCCDRPPRRPAGAFVRLRPSPPAVTLITPADPGGASRRVRWPSLTLPRAGRRDRRGRRRPDDGGPDPARRARPDRLVDGDRGPPRQRRSGDQRRAAAGRRQPGPDPVRHGGRPADPVGQDLHRCTPSRRRSAASSRSCSPTDEQTIASTKAKFTIHDPTQLVVAVVAEHPEAIVGNLRLLPNQNQVAPLVMSVSPRGPARSRRGAGARSTGSSGRTSTPTGSRRAARRAPRLGGRRRPARHRRRDGRTPVTRPRSRTTCCPTARPPRPTSPPAALSGLLGAHPDWRDGPAGAVRRARRGPGPGDGRRSGRGGRARLRRGPGDAPRLRSGGGLDRRDRKAADGLWRRLLPARDDRRPRLLRRQTCWSSAVSQLPSLALPPIGGPDRAARRLHPADRPDQLPRPAAARPPRVGVAHDAGPDRRVRGRRVRLRVGAPRQRGDRQRGRHRPRRAGRHRRARRRSTSGVFSPSRGTYQVRGPGRRAAVVADQRRLLRRRRHGGALDVLQGDPARVRDLAVGFGSLRTIRAETPVSVPLIQADLRLEDGTPQGHGHERLDGTPRAAGGGPRRDGRDPQGPRARRRRDRRRRRSRPTSSASRCRTRSSARRSSATDRAAATTRRASTSATRSSTS